MCFFAWKVLIARRSSMMPYNPPYYLELMEKCGLTKAKDLYAFFMDRDHETMEKYRQWLIRSDRQLHFR